MVRAFIYDLHEGLKRQYVRYIILFVTIIITCIHIDGTIYNDIDMRQYSVGFVNYVIYMFQGIRPINQNFNKEYEMPVFWLFFNIYILFVLGGYTADSLKKDKCQCLVRFKSRVSFIISKYVYIFVGTLIYYGCLYFSIMCHMIFRAKIIWYEPHISKPVNAFGIRIFPSDCYVVCVIVIIPFLTSCLYMLMCIIAEIYDNTIIGIVVICIYIVAGVYIPQSYCISNNMMLCRNEYVMSDGISIIKSLFILSCMMLCSIVVGIMRIKRYEYISKERLK